MNVETYFLCNFVDPLRPTFDGLLIDSWIFDGLLVDFWWTRTARDGHQLRLTTSGQKHVIYLAPFKNTSATTYAGGEPGAVA